MTPRAAPGRITTFYSYKGGTGRSMLLANVAWILASAGKRVHFFRTAASRRTCVTSIAYEYKRAMASE